MSSGDPKTRAKILKAARKLVEERPGNTVSMGDVARQAGISRQALYLHFDSRVSLFLELSRVVDATYRTPQRQRRVDQAPTGRQALHEAVALQAWLKPRLHGVAAAFDALRHTDQAARAAWEERDSARLGRCEQVIARLHAEGELVAGWTVANAAQMMWALTSQRVWEDLVLHQRWSASQYTRHVTMLLESALLKQDVPRSHLDLSRASMTDPTLSHRQRPAGPAGRAARQSPAPAPEQPGAASSSP